jgi:hypothetical protein
MSLIPKIIFQTSKSKPTTYVVDMVKNMCPGFVYIHFTDDDIINFFNNNYMYEFRYIINKFNSIKGGAHKADLFRYYFIYIKGGVFLDSDAMLQTDINNITKDYDFFSVESTHYCKGCIFQGLIGAKANNRIIYEALVNAYNININKLNNDYLLLCRNLFKILKKKWNYKVNIYKEIYGSDEVAITIDNNNKIILAHYFSSKIVPPEYLNTNHLKQKNVLKRSRYKFLLF